MGHLYHSYVRLEGKPYVSSPASFASSTVRRGRWRAADSAPLGSKGFPLDESWNFTSRSTSKASCQVFPGFPWFPEKKGFHWGFDTGYKDKCIYIYIYIYCVYTYMIISLGISYDLCGNMRDISPQDVIRVCRNSPLKALDVIWI